jgi:hypothetical protein
MKYILHKSSKISENITEECIQSIYLDKHKVTPKIPGREKIGKVVKAVV